MLNRDPIAAVPAATKRPVRRPSPLAPKKKIPTRLPLGRATCLGTLLGPRITAAISPQIGKTSVKRQTRRGEHSQQRRSYDPPVYEWWNGVQRQSGLSSCARVCEMEWQLRRRPRSNRVRRNRLVIDQPGLKVLLLLAQPLAADQGTQLAAECPRGRTRSRQPHAARVDPSVAQRSNGDGS